MKTNFTKAEAMDFVSTMLDNGDFINITKGMNGYPENVHLGYISDDIDELHDLAEATGGEVVRVHRKDGWDLWVEDGGVGRHETLGEDFNWNFGADTEPDFFAADYFFGGAVGGYRSRLEELRQEWNAAHAHEQDEDEDMDDDDMDDDDWDDDDWDDDEVEPFAEDPAIVKHLSDLADDEFAIYIQPWGEPRLEEWGTFSRHSTHWHDAEVTEYRCVLVLPKDEDEDKDEEEEEEE